MLADLVVPGLLVLGLLTVVGIPLALLAMSYRRFLQDDGDDYTGRDQPEVTIDE